LIFALFIENVTVFEICFSSPQRTIFWSSSRVSLARFKLPPIGKEPDNSNDRIDFSTFNDIALRQKLSMEICNLFIQVSLSTRKVQYLLSDREMHALSP
jgi:hypothetical protein